MQIQLEEMLCYPLLALIELAVFYSIYFGKMLLQKQHGIRTYQIGPGRKKNYAPWKRS